MNGVWTLDSPVTLLGGVSLSAGVGEELFYRGFLVWYFVQGMPFVWAALVSSVLFGLAQVTHGVQATVRATLLGCLLVGLTLVSGALWASMILHTAIDLTSGETGAAVFGQARES